MEKLKLSSTEIIKMLEERVIKYDIYEECELNELDKLSIKYMKDDNSVFINASDGLLVMPYEYTYCTETFLMYEILALDSFYMAHDEPENIAQKINYLKELISLMEA